MLILMSKLLISFGYREKHLNGQGIHATVSHVVGSSQIKELEAIKDRTQRHLDFCSVKNEVQTGCSTPKVTVAVANFV